MNFQIRLKSSSVFVKGSHYIDRHDNMRYTGCSCISVPNESGGRAHKSNNKKIFPKVPWLEMNRLAYRRM